MEPASFHGLRDARGLPSAGGRLGGGRDISSSQPSISSGGSVFDRVTDADARLIVIDGDDPAATLAYFEMMARRAGAAVYAWTASTGLQSVKSRDIALPGTRRLADALRHILQTTHFGIYLFNGFENDLGGACVRVVLRLLGAGGADRKVVLVGRDVVLPATLENQALRISHRPTRPGRPRLRGGRWVR